MVVAVKVLRLFVGESVLQCTPAFGMVLTWYTATSPATYDSESAGARRATYGTTVLLKYVGSFFLFLLSSGVDSRRIELLYQRFFGHQGL